MTPPLPTEPPHLGALANLAGFAAGTTLYAMLLVMARRWRPDTGPASPPATRPVDLTLTTGALGLVWNVGALGLYGALDFGIGRAPTALAVVSFAALVWLPAVVVHSILRRRREAPDRFPLPLVAAGYALALASTALLVVDAAAGAVPSPRAMRVQTFGHLAMLVPLLAVTRRHALWPRAGTLLALAVYALSATHLAQHEGFVRPWYIEVVAHHASLPLAAAILHQDYRFAFGDLFLKRALALVGLSAASFLAYALILVPLWTSGLAVDDPRAAGVVVSLLAALAVAYPPWRRACDRFVDATVLRRASARAVVAEVTRASEGARTVEALLDGSCALLRDALSADRVEWRELAAPVEPQGDLVRVPAGAPATAAQVLVAATDAPRYLLEIGRLRGGRRLFSDDIQLLESVALLLARRVDAHRLATERLARRLRDEEVAHLSAEAELRALREQLHPHFLFNALTTVGYLIETDPPRALDTLLRLTGLLRRVTSSTQPVTTLGEELEFVEAYLDIERARFEERLDVHLDVPDHLRPLAVPPFVVQTLVENAIKHGIAPSTRGGRVEVRATLEATGAGDRLSLTVSDTGAGPSREDLAQGRRHGIGLANLERRLQLTGGPSASLSVQSRPAAGTTVTVRLPVPAAAPAIATTTPTRPWPHAHAAPSPAEPT